jgi:hypothetical protein
VIAWKKMNVSHTILVHAGNHPVPNHRASTVDTIINKIDFVTSFLFYEMFCTAVLLLFEFFSIVIDLYCFMPQNYLFEGG